MIDEKIIEAHNRKDTAQFLEDLYKFKEEVAHDLSLMDSIIEYCNRFDMDITKVGEMLADHKEFKEIFEKSITKTKYYQGGEIEIEMDEEEWL